MQLTLPIIFGFALADSVNPVSFGVLMRLLSNSRDSEEQKNTGYQYISSYYCTYTALGIFLAVILSTISAFSGLIFSLIGLLIFTLGLLELNRLHPVSHKLKKFLADPKLRIDQYYNNIEGQPATSLSLGINTAVKEFFFSGSFYLGLISLLVINKTGPDRYSFILLYNVIVILPLLIITVMTRNKEKLEDFKLWKPNVRRTMMIGIACLQTVLGVWLMLWWFV